MKLSRRILSRAITISIIFILLNGYFYINSSVSYKYEVQDTEFAGQVLDAHQKSIMLDIVIAKVVGSTSLLLFFVLVFIRLNEPTFKGKVSYRE